MPSEEDQREVDMREWMSIRAEAEAERYKFVLVRGALHIVDRHGTGPEPSLGEMLVEATGVDLTNDAAVENVDEDLESGEVVLGYFGDGAVEIHSPLTTPYPSVVATIGHLFGRVRITAPGWTAETGRTDR